MDDLAKLRTLTPVERDAIRAKAQAAAAKVTPLMASAVSRRRIVCFMRVPIPGCRTASA